MSAGVSNVHVRIRRLVVDGSTIRDELASGNGFEDAVRSALAAHLGGSKIARGPHGSANAAVAQALGDAVATRVAPSIEQAAAR
jgi:adenylylsulfate kinase-like enzyme